MTIPNCAPEESIYAKVTCCLCKKELPANSIRYDVTKHNRVICDECVDRMVEEKINGKR